MAEIPTPTPGYLSVDCEACGEPIERQELASAVMVRHWMPRHECYVSSGPYHAQCAPAAPSVSAKDTQPRT